MERKVKGKLRKWQVKEEIGKRKPTSQLKKICMLSEKMFSSYVSFIQFPYEKFPSHFQDET
jgi:hypothetical protein